MKNNITKILAAAATALSLGACDDDTVTTRAYENVAECKAADVYDDAYCETSFEKAQKAHEQSAPRYRSLSDCEQDYGQGQCGTQSTTIINNGGGQDSGSFLPFMMGYMMAGGNSNTNQYYSQPLYADRYGNYYTADRRPLTRDVFSRSGTRLPEAIMQTRTPTFRAPVPAATAPGTSAPVKAPAAPVNGSGGFGASGGVTAKTESKTPRPAVSNRTSRPSFGGGGRSKGRR